MKKPRMSIEEAKFLNDFRVLIGKYESSHWWGSPLRLLGGSTYQQDLRDFVRKYFDRLNGVGLLYSEDNESRDNPKRLGTERLSLWMVGDVALSGRSGRQMAKQSVVEQVMKDVKNAIEEKILGDAVTQLYHTIIQPRLALPVAERDLAAAKKKFRESEQACGAVLQDLEILKQKKAEMDPAAYQLQLEQLTKKYDELNVKFQTYGVRVQKLMAVVEKSKDEHPDNHSIEVFCTNFKDLFSSQEQIDAVFAILQEEIESEKVTIGMEAHFGSRLRSDAQREKEIGVILDDNWIGVLKDDIKSRFDQLPTVAPK